MSHQEYIEGCDEDQLACLVEMAQARIAKIRATGWTKLWTVSIGWGNIAWFADGDYEAAIDYACKAVKTEAAKHPDSGSEMAVKLERYRPEEVAELLAPTAGFAATFRAQRGERAEPGQGSASATNAGTKDQ